MLRSQQAVADGLNSRVRSAVRVAEAGFSCASGLLCVAVPDWQGWKELDFTREQTFGHLARWEIYFTSGTEEFTAILRVTWPSLTEILLKFIYPDDRGLVSVIARQGCIALLDRQLRNGQPDPRSRGMMLEQIPSDLPDLFGLGQPLPRGSIQ